MDIFKRFGKHKVASPDFTGNLIKPAMNGLAIIIGNDFRRGKHAGMRFRASNVLTIKPLVIAN